MLQNAYFVEPAKLKQFEKTPKHTLPRVQLSRAAHGHRLHHVLLRYWQPLHADSGKSQVTEDQYMALIFFGQNHFQFFSSI
jgi:hypothetical protein